MFVIRRMQVAIIGCSISHRVVVLLVAAASASAVLFLLGSLIAAALPRLRSTASYLALMYPSYLSSPLGYAFAVVPNRWLSTGKTRVFGPHGHPTSRKTQDVGHSRNIPTLSQKARRGWDTASIDDVTALPGRGIAGRTRRCVRGSSSWSERGLPAPAVASVRRWRKCSAWLRLPASID